MPGESRLRDLSWFAVLLLLTILPAGAQNRAGVPRNVLLIGWDGAQRAHVNECLARGELPVLQQMASEGRMVNIDVRGTTDTKAGWSQILTGYNPEVTGVFGNRRYGPIPRGLSVFERLESAFGSDSIVTAAVIGKKGHVDADGPKRVALDGLKPVRRKALIRKSGGVVITEGEREYLQIPAKPYFYTKEGIDLFINGLIQNDTVAIHAMALLERYKDSRVFFFVHFAEIDHNGHRDGENAPSYSEALRSCDRWTGEILKKLKSLGLYEQTLVYVTADHGFDEGSTRHQNAPEVFLVTNDPLVAADGTRADITPTILDRFGVSTATLRPPLDGVSLIRR